MSESWPVSIYATTNSLFVHKYDFVCLSHGETEYAIYQRSEVREVIFVTPYMIEQNYHRSRQEAFISMRRGTLMALTSIEHELTRLGVDLVELDKPAQDEAA